MFENCTEIRSLFSSYLDDGCELAQIKSIRFHLDQCGACRLELDRLQTVQSDLRTLPRRRMSSEQSLRLLVMLSQYLHNDWLGQLRVRLDNSLKALLVPAVEG